MRHRSGGIGLGHVISFQIRFFFLFLESDKRVVHYIFFDFKHRINHRSCGHRNTGPTQSRLTAIFDFPRNIATYSMRSHNIMTYLYAFAVDHDYLRVGFRRLPVSTSKPCAAFNLIFYYCPVDSLIIEHYNIIDIR